MSIFLATLLAVAALTSGNTVKSSDGNFELLILHNNDMHARFEQTSQRSGACTTDDREAGKCYGGFPRVATVVKEARRAAQTGEGPPVLYLNAGDTYTGTAWFTIYKWKIAAEFINALKPDAVALGNNEVTTDSKISPLLGNIDTVILATNVNIKSAEKTTNIQKSVIFNIQDIKVGVVGYLTPESRMLDSVGNVEYIDEVLALTEEVEKLKELNVNIIIALGHSSLDKEQEIAREVTGLDMIIAGNKNQFYWNGNTVSDSRETTVVTQKSGKKVPIVYSTAYNKHFGSVKITFDADGEIIEYNDNAILLNSSIPQDVKSLDILKKYASEIESKSDEVLGDTAVLLDAATCVRWECNFANFVTDGMIYYYATRYEGQTWTDASIAMIHNGALGDSIVPANRPGAVTQADLLAALPVASSLVAVTIDGRQLMQVLEHSVASFTTQSFNSQFLHFSGIRVEYNVREPRGSRVVNAVVRCGNCLVPEFENIDNVRNYKIIMPAAIADGEFGYDMLVGAPRTNLPYDEFTTTSEFIRLRSPVYPEVANRITIRGSATAIASSFLIINLLAAFVYMLK